MEPKIKRVLFIITQSEFGGAQRFLYSFLNKIDRQNYEILVATGQDGDGAFLNALEKLNIKTRIIYPLHRSESFFDDLKSIQSINKLIKEFKPETVFLNSSKAGFIGSLAARLSKIKPQIIYRIGGWSFNDPVSKFNKINRQFLEKVSAGWKDWIVINNNHDLQQAEKLGFKPKKGLRLIYNGIDTYKLELLPSLEAREFILRKINETHQIQMPKKIIGTIANFYPVKGLEYLISAAEKVSNSDTIFCIIGEGEEYQKIQRLIIDKNLNNRVFLLGRIENASRYLSAFDVFVLPSLKEGFPWSVLEAMAAKLPIVATRVGGIPEMIEDGVSGLLVEPQSSEQLAEAINYLVGHESKAQEMGIQAHQKALFSFSLETMASQVEKLL
jgi:glycosyltransferase involved in cell wall biosynthesis